VRFIVTAEGYAPVTTHLFDSGSPYLDSDAVFGVKASLVREFRPVEDPEPYRTVHFDIVLRRT
jgi:hydroxyquinol 1,2-dioxygenase